MDDVNYFFDGWDPVIRIFVVGTLSYILLVILLKVSGKRTLAQMSGFDFLITVAIGSTFGRLITAKDVTLTESAAAFLLLILLQLGFAYLDMRFGWFSQLTKSKPTLLFYRGSFLYDNIHECRINKEEILGIIREQGIESLDDVEAVVLETSGGWSVVRKGKHFIEDLDKSTLAPLRQAREAKERKRKKDKKEES